MSDFGGRGPRAPEPTAPSLHQAGAVGRSADQVWSWDITKLRPVKWTYYYLYVILDIFSRYVVGWMLAFEKVPRSPNASSPRAVASRTLNPTSSLHADRGSSMRSKPVGLLLHLGVTKTHSRPYVSNDNPYSESQFKTMKYCPQFPSRFGSAEDGRLFCCGFFAYYNFHHRHSGIGLMTPADVHYGRAEQSPPVGARSFSKLNRLIPNASFRNAATARFASAGLDQPAAGKNDPPRCRTSPSRGGVHTWGTPFFCFTQRDLDRWVVVDRADLTSLPTIIEAH